MHGFNQGKEAAYVRFQHLKDKDFADAVAQYLPSKVRLNKSHGYDVIISNTILADLVVAGKSETTTIDPLLRLDRFAALRGFFDAEGGVDPTHGFLAHLTPINP